MWASELSELRHAQAERPPTERSGARGACANVKRRLGANPRTGFVKVSLTQLLDAGTKVRRWYCVGSDRKYVGAKQVVRGDPLKPGLEPPGLEETDHSGVTERVRPSRQGAEGSVGRTTKGDTEQHSSCTTTWFSGRASEPDTVASRDTFAVFLSYGCW